MRRGTPSANARWGNNIAIPGRRLLVRDGVAAGVAPRTRYRPSSPRPFAQLVTGQMRETKGAIDGQDPVEHYLSVVYDKTACLISASGRFGATFSGATDDQIEQLARLGGLVGTAFQISDDIIDIDSEPDESGRCPGRTCAKGPTLCRSVCPEETGPDAARLRELLQGPVQNDDDLAGLSRCSGLPDGIAKAKADVQRYVARAEDELDALPDVPGRRALESLIDYTANRHG